MEPGIIGFASRAYLPTMGETQAQRPNIPKMGIHFSLFPPICFLKMHVPRPLIHQLVTCIELWIIFMIFER